MRVPLYTRYGQSLYFIFLFTVIMLPEECVMVVINQRLVLSYVYEPIVDFRQ